MRHELIVKHYNNTYLLNLIKENVCAVFSVAITVCNALELEITINK